MAAIGNYEVLQSTLQFNPSLNGFPVVITIPGQKRALSAVWAQISATTCIAKRIDISPDGKEVTFYITTNAGTIQHEGEYTIVIAEMG